MDSITARQSKCIRKEYGPSQRYPISLAPGPFFLARRKCLGKRANAGAGANRKRASHSWRCMRNSWFGYNSWSLAIFSFTLLFSIFSIAPFLPARPCFCDALAYGYLSVAASMPVRTGRLADAVGGNNNLSKYIARMKALTGGQA